MSSFWMRSSRTAARWSFWRSRAPFLWGEGITLSLLDGFVPEPDNLNDTSLCLRIDAGEASFLITGDGETPVEDRLREGGEPIDADILVAGHHGSSTSSRPVSYTHLDVYKRQTVQGFVGEVFLNTFSQLARSHRIIIAAGGLYQIENGRLTNRQYLFSDTGEVAAVQDKLYPERWERSMGVSACLLYTSTPIPKKAKSCASQRQFLPMPRSM